jgi:hypothetical protein
MQAMTTSAKDIKPGMKFDNFGEVIEVVSVTKVEGAIIIQWSGYFGNEHLEDWDSIYLPRV